MALLIALALIMTLMPSTPITDRVARWTSTTTGKIVFFGLLFAAGAGTGIALGHFFSPAPR